MNKPSKQYPYLYRDISWLHFNHRVLQEAKDKSVPLLSRIQFLAIFSSNLDEYFKVRIGQMRNLIRIGKKTKKELGFDPKDTLKQIHAIVNEQQEEFSQIFNDTIPELRKQGINLLRRLDLDKEQMHFIENYFHSKLLPFIQPVLLVKNKIRPFLNNASLYLAIMLKEKNKPTSPTLYAIVNIPSGEVPRFIILPSHRKRKNLIILDDIVRQSVSWMFPGYDVIDTYSIKLTRDAELYIDDEFSGDLISKIRDSLSKRNVGPAARLVYDRNMPKHFLEFLMETFGMEKLDLLPEGRYHNNFDFFKFPDFGRDDLKYRPLPPLPYPPLRKAKDIFSAFKEKDHIVNFPYNSYESVIRLFEDAAKDPDITHIKIIQYRTAKKSRIQQALMNAVKAGKQVTAFIEVKARFDEKNNLEWGEKLEKAGVRVIYSFPGLKVHSKLVLFRRLEDGKPVLYSYLSTGNFHEGTASIYSDFGLFTADTRITKEVAGVFYFLENFKKPPHDFEHLLVGQFNLRSTLEELIDYETRQAKMGNKAKITIKCNSLQDPAIITKLYDASNAGVKIKLIIRGICSLIPGLPKISENIEGISIVDRFLEHSRVFEFYHSGEDLIYLSSADLMHRNLSGRVETAFPILDKEIKREIKDYLGIQWSDNIKARILDDKNSITYKSTDSDLPIRAQIETYYYYKRKNEILRKAKLTTK
ncbi:MAG TPA: polyphosphate kinase 1 [Saprospiraceae bacterium]|nr:polyphosphate kinase 1 [Saprospiraceae bacterium]